MGRINTSSLLAVVVLGVLGLGLLTGGLAAVDAPAPVAAGQAPHSCHGAPLQDVDHSTAVSARGAADPFDVPADRTCTVVAVGAPVATESPLSRPTDRSPPTTGAASITELQVFRI